MTYEHPTYEELMNRTDAPAGSTWGIFGEQDRRGTINLIGQKQISEAGTLVREGRVFGLDYPLTAFDPPLAPTRKPPVQTVFSRHAAHRDESLLLYPQASSQIDGLRHRRHSQHGFYNRVSDAEADQANALGINDWAEAGIAGRGLLLDLEGFFAQTGRRMDHERGQVFTLRDLREACDFFGIHPHLGDLLLINSGWAAWYLDLDANGKRAVRDAKRYSGLDQDRNIIAWCWDSGVAGIFSDCYALEALPAKVDTDFYDDLDHGMMHQELLALMGYPIGELWRLEDLARHCRAQGQWEFMLTVKPLNMPGGVGSPCNAMAIM